MILMDENEISTKAEEWFLLAESLEWKSFDPFDLLLSPYFENLQETSPLAARVCIQFGKRSGRTVRQLCKVTPHEEAKTISDYLEAAVLFAECQEAWATRYLRTLAHKLVEKAITTPIGMAWGLEFPYTTRFINVKARTPNIYQTANAVHAFLKLYSFTSSPEYLQYAVQGSDYILNCLGSFKKDGLSWFRYWPNSDAPIVNIQATIANIFSYLGKLTNDEKFLKASEKAIHTVLSVQNPNGSWYYSVDGKANFIDGFHTGFILQGIMEYISHHMVNNQSEVSKALQNGFMFFKKNLVSPDGMPRGFAQGRVSLDGQNFAQCIQTISRCGQSSEDYQIGLQMWCKMINIPSLKRQTFPLLRWVYGPAVLASAFLLHSSTNNKLGILN